MNRFIVIVAFCALFAVSFGVPHGGIDIADKLAETNEYAMGMHEGHYNYNFDTSNGIKSQESGAGGHYVSGTSEYISPEGVVIKLSYTADENGFHPEGDHLPTPPPIPEEILESLRYNAEHPEEEEDEGQYHEFHHQQEASQHHFHHFQ